VTTARTRTRPRAVLVLNAGSSTIKYRLDGGDRMLASGLLERIGEDGARLVHRLADGDERVVERPVADHAEGFRLLFAELGHPADALLAVGHRIVHGGDRFTNPTLVDDAVFTELEALTPLAPLHYPAGTRGIEVAREVARLVDELVERAAEQGATLRPMTAAGARARIERAVTAAAAAHDALPGYHTETVLWSGRTASDDGVPAANLLRRVEGRGLDRVFPPGAVEQREPGLTDGGLLAVLGTASDDRLSQLRAGEALSAVVLHATRAGLATCPLSEVLEIEETRTALRDEVLEGTLTPQLLVRIGWAPPEPLPATPRLPVDATIDGPLSEER